MAADKSAEAKKDVDPKKDAATDEKSIEVIVEGMTEEELKGVAGGLAAGDVTKPVMRCVGVECSGLRTDCYAYCTIMTCPSVKCDSLKCPSFEMPS